jgi:beta-glucanase (GH16 family)
MKKVLSILLLMFILVSCVPSENIIFRRATQTPTKTRTQIPSRTASPTRTRTRTRTLSPSQTLTPTLLPSNTSTPTLSSTDTLTPIPVPSDTPTLSVGDTLTPTLSLGDTLVPTLSSTDTLTPTPVPSLTFTPTPTQTFQPVGVTGNWVMVFDDEFNGTSLDSTKWYTCYPWQGTICDNTNTKNMWYTPQNVTVGNGICRLTALKQTFNGRPYTSGMISSTDPDGAFVNGDFQYGFLEVRVKVPAGGPGLWPAYWMIGMLDWPPELDIFEINGTYTNAPINLAYGWGSNGNVTWTPIQYYRPTDTNFYFNYHVYAADWEPGVISWYIDGVKVRTFTSSNVTTMRMFILLTLQLGGGGSGVPTPANSELPAYMDIDYVRVWQKAP